MTETMWRNQNTLKKYLYGERFEEMEQLNYSFLIENMNSKKYTDMLEKSLTMTNELFPNG